MRKLIGRTHGAQAFTLVELMIVVVIVAILALVAIPLYQGNVTSAKMSEGIAGVGTIRTALRVYAAGHNGSYPTIAAGTTADSLTAYGIATGDLEGRYFAATDYTVTSAAAAYTIRATLDDDNYYEINHAGTESGSYRTGQ